MRRQLSVLATTAVAAAAVALPTTSANAAPAASSSGASYGQHGKSPSPQWYLALGDSLAAGYQPTTGDDKTGGYVGGALAMLKKQNKNVRLTNLGCSGETTTTFLTGTKCKTKRSQLAQALHFLKGHAHQSGVITIDLGANDIDGCLPNGAIDMQCLTNGLADVDKNLPSILQKLHAAAPNTKIVVLNYYNPFLAAYLQGPSGQTLAHLSGILATTFNGEIADAAATIDAPVADVAGAFQSDDWTPTSSPFGTLPTNVARICEWTWMCTKQNIHANDAGYAVMASTLAPYLEP